MKWMLLVCLVLGSGFGHRRTTKVLHMDQVEINHFYDKNANYVYTQAIIYDQQGDHLVNYGWALLGTNNVVDFLDRERKVLYLANDSGKIKIVVIHYGILHETWTQFDRERENTLRYWNRGSGGANLWDDVQIPHTTNEQE